MKWEYRLFSTMPYSYYTHFHNIVIINSQFSQIQSFVLLDSLVTRAYFLRLLLFDCTIYGYEATIGVMCPAGADR